jgi:HD-like signal output (HDOD) protein
MLAEKWELPADLTEVITSHHAPEKTARNARLVALVHIADLLCRMSGLNYGYVEERQVNLFEDSGFALLVQDFTSLREFDWARFTFEVDSYLDEVHGLIRSIYRT